MSLFTCPAPSALGAIPAIACPIRFDQIQKIAFQRKQSSAPFASESALNTQSNWTTLLTASNATKVIVSPHLTNLVIPPSEALTEGGNDNTTLNGMTRLMGGSNVTVTAELRNASAEAILALKALTSESAIMAGFSNLSGFFFNKDGKIIHNDLFGFDIFNFFISDPGSEGYLKDNVCTVRFEMKYGWADAAALSSPSFNPLNL